MNKSAVFDFKLRRSLGQILSTIMWKGVTDVRRPFCFLAAHDVAAKTRIQ
jgi:hypothetical protein